MNKLLLHKPAENQINNHSSENNLQKSNEKTPTKKYVQSKIEETFRNKRFKLNYFNLQLYNGISFGQEKNGFKNRNKFIPKLEMIKNNQIIGKGNKINKKRRNQKKIFLIWIKMNIITII